MPPIALAAPPAPLTSAAPACPPASMVPTIDFKPTSMPKSCCIRFGPSMTASAMKTLKIDRWISDADVSPSIIEHARP